MAALAAALAGLLVALTAATVGATTESSDAAALGNLYTSWNSPSQLAGWSASGGDPCSTAWQGVTCTGSGVTEIKLAGTGLNGSLGYELSNLYSLKTLDLSNNNIRGSIPYQLPPNLTYLNLATNNFSGNLPYSISNMASIEYLSGSIHAYSSADALIFFVWTMVFFRSCKVQVEKAKQDDALSDLSYILTKLKGMAIDMGSETGSQTSDLDHAEKDFDELNFRVKGENNRNCHLFGR